MQMTLYMPTKQRHLNPNHRHHRNNSDQIWTVSQDWETAWDGWKTGLFTDLDVEEMESAAGTFTKKVYALQENSKGAARGRKPCLLWAPCASVRGKNESSMSTRHYDRSCFAPVRYSETLIRSALGRISSVPDGAPTITNHDFLHRSASSVET